MKGLSFRSCVKGNGEPKDQAGQRLGGDRKNLGKGKKKKKKN